MNVNLLRRKDFGIFSSKDANPYNVWLVSFNCMGNSYWTMRTFDTYKEK